MGYGERNIWSQVVTSTIGAIVYAAIVVPQLWTQPVHEVRWAAPMLWTIGLTVTASILLSITLGIAAGIADPEEDHRADQRDRDIDRFGDRVGGAFLIAGGVGALILAMLEAEWFWIGNAVFAGFTLFAVVGGVARLMAYRRGLA